MTVPLKKKIHQHTERYPNYMIMRKVLCEDPARRPPPSIQEEASGENKFVISNVKFLTFTAISLANSTQSVYFVFRHSKLKRTRAGIELWKPLSVCFSHIPSRLLSPTQTCMPCCFAFPEGLPCQLLQN